MATWSFQDIKAAFEGPGGAFPLAPDSGNAAEGISFAPAGDKNIMTEGAGGEIMHSLRASQAGTLTITLLKTSNTNGLLQGVYNFQASSAKLWGKNSVVITNTQTGEVSIFKQGAFAKLPDKSWAEEGGTVAWTLHGTLFTNPGLYTE